VTPPLVERAARLAAELGFAHSCSEETGRLLHSPALGDRELAQKTYLLEDCTSPVVVPGVTDYTEKADAAFARFAAAGMHVVRSTDPIESWPGIAASARG